VVTIGAVTIAIGMLSFNLVAAGWHMLVPAMFMGVAHAIMFPTVVAGGSTSFPPRYRGLGTTFMLAMFDLGSFLAFVSVGAMIVAAKHFGLPAYETMFVIVTGLLSAVGITYFLMSRETPGRMLPAPECAAAYVTTDVLEQDASG
jgi:MFS family permease